jgi:glycosyltransferase involved in cell wall biosynthesis
MHVLFVHKEFPGHFGHLARYLARHHGVECTFVYSNLPSRFGGRVPPGMDAGIRLIPYQARGASAQTHFCNLHTEISLWHAQAVYETLKARPDVRPDVVVGHSVFGMALFLPDLYHSPLVVHCEFYERPRRPYTFGRPDFPPLEADLLRARAQNATNLHNLQAATAAYSPTEWQRGLYPAEYQPRIETIFDGVDCDFWQRRTVPRRIGNLAVIPSDMRVVTYCSYGLEALRGFDIFMKVAKQIGDVRPDVLFVVVGADRAYYGEDRRHLQASSFAQHVLAQDRYDLRRFVFTGQVLEDQLADILSLSDLHVYLTMPFVLSWSLFDALACGCTVLASDTAPVREVIRHEENGLLADFFDVDGLAALALRVLDDPAGCRALGQAGRRLVEEQYSLPVTAPQMLDLYRRAIRGESGRATPGS